jgi:hypothetical protein
MFTLLNIYITDLKICNVVYQLGIWQKIRFHVCYYLLHISLNLKTGLIRLVMTNYYSGIKQYNKPIEYRYIII